MICHNWHSTSTTSVNSSSHYQNDYERSLSVQLKRQMKINSLPSERRKPNVFEHVVHQLTVWSSLTATCPSQLQRVPVRSWFYVYAEKAYGQTAHKSIAPWRQRNEIACGRRQKRAQFQTDDEMRTNTRRVAALRQTERDRRVEERGETQWESDRRGAHDKKT